MQERQLSLSSLCTYVLISPDDKDFLLVNLFEKPVHNAIFLVCLFVCFLFVFFFLTLEVPITTKADDIYAFFFPEENKS